MMADALALHSQRSIATGSKSFAVAARLLEPSIREGAHNFYAWCRHCDDVIDGQSSGRGTVTATTPPHERFELLEAQTRAALAGRPCSQPAFAALARLVDRHALPHAIPLDILDGFRMDVEGSRFRTLDDLFRYCYGVAGAVGVGMAILMGVRPEDRPTLDRACDLGLAFQLTNIARDVMDDARAGRLYIPDEVFGRDAVTPAFVLASPNHAAVVAAAYAMLDLAEVYYASARLGLAALPWRSAWAISTALGIYREIGLRVRQRQNPWARRVSVPCWRKIVHAAAGITVPVLGSPARASREGLWTRQDGFGGQRAKLVAAPSETILLRTPIALLPRETPSAL